jgi:cobalt-zinc-cadmium efflux system outer membrane protein
MPLTELAGRVDLPVPVYEYEKVLQRILQQHTDVLTAEASFQQARLRLQQAKVQPIPDVDVRLLLQRDYTGPPFEIAPSISVSVPMPVWDRNQGGIRQAQANLVNMSEEPHRVRTVLTTTLSQAFQRYQDNRVLLGYYRDQILPDLVRVYSGVYERYLRQADVGGGPSLSDVVVAQGNLAAAVQTYVTTLGGMWQAVVDVTDLLQTDDLFQISGVPTDCPAPVPNLEQLAPLPCRHPCEPVPQLHQAPPTIPWPPTQPRNQTPAMSPASEPSGRTEVMPQGPPRPTATEGAPIPASAGAPPPRELIQPAKEVWLPLPADRH